MCWQSLAYLLRKMYNIFKHFISRWKAGHVFSTARDLSGSIHIKFQWNELTQKRPKITTPVMELQIEFKPVGFFKDA